PLEIAREFVLNKFGLQSEDYVVRDVYQTQVPPVHHVYLRQRISGLEVANANMNINIDGENRIISFGSAPGSQRPQLYRREPVLAPTDAVVRLAQFMRTPIQNPDQIVELMFENLDGEGPAMVLQDVDISTDGDVPVGMSFIATDGGELVQTYSIVLQTDQAWVHAFVDTQGGNVVALNSWTAHAQYRVFPLGANDPEADQRQLVDSQSLAPGFSATWHSMANGTTFTDTQGNNVHAQADPTGRGDWLNLPRPQGNKDLQFDFPLDLTQAPSAYSDAAITNLFYWNNIIHDIFYSYGFNEVAGNFQTSNGDKGGRGGDAVVANGQNGAGTNNADFATPPDGIRPRMRMYLWTVTNPQRDGDLESDIIIHEYGHGISNRLTGGPANANCLGWGESGGMGEGWSDFFSVVFRMKATHTASDNMLLGEYVMAGRGIRRYPYSINQGTNPFSYASLNSISTYDPHTIGTVWASILYELYWNLLETLPFQPDLYSASPNHGNTLALLLVVTGLKLQPCRPTFVTARNAIVQAEELLTHGQNKCAVWRAFAKRGLGIDA
ncbi:Fungalysin metallopeptidase-domain-containing protein, partial [Dimargaris cristalligena]